MPDYLAWVTKLSELEIDADKDWNGKKIINVGEISVGDIIFAHGYRLTEIDGGIALVNPKGEIIKEWKETR